MGNFSSKKSYSDNIFISYSVCSSENISYYYCDIKNSSNLSDKTLRALGRSEQRILTMFANILGFVSGLFKLSKLTYKPVDADTLTILFVFNVYR